MRLPRWLGGKPDSEPPQITDVLPEPIKATTVDEINFYERIRVMHVQSHPTSRFYPLNGLPAEEVHKRGQASWFLHQLGKDPSLEEVSYALSEQFQLDKQAFKEK